MSKELWNVSLDDYLISEETYMEREYRKFVEKLSKYSVRDRKEVDLIGYLFRVNGIQSYENTLKYLFKGREKYALAILTPSFDVNALGNVSKLKDNGVFVLLLESKVGNLRKLKSEMKGTIFRVQGKLMHFKEYLPYKASLLQGVFILAEDVSKVSSKEYLKFVPPKLNGRNVRAIIYRSASEDLAKPLLLKLTASSTIYGRVGGITTSLLTFGEDYSVKSEEWKTLRKIIPSQLYKTFKPKVRVYDKLNVATATYTHPVGYFVKKPSEYSSFLWYRLDESRVEHSEITQVEESTAFDKDIGITTMSDLVYVPYRKEAVFIEEDILQEEIFDIAYFSFYNYVKSPLINTSERERVIPTIIEKIKDNYPEIYSLTLIPDDVANEEGLRMRLFSLREAGGFGEHIMRVVDSLDRLNVQNTDSVFWEEYLQVMLDRFYEANDNRIKNEFNRASTILLERKNFLKIRRINEMLQSLNMRNPDGWYEESFVREALSRDIESDEAKALRLLQHLIENGTVYKKGEDEDGRERYYAAVSVI